MMTKKLKKKKKKKKPTQELQTCETKTGRHHPLQWFSHATDLVMQMRNDKQVEKSALVVPCCMRQSLHVNIYIYVYVCVYIYAHIHVDIHMYIHIRTYI